MKTLLVAFYLVSPGTEPVETVTPAPIVVADPYIYRPWIKAELAQEAKKQKAVIKVAKKSN